MPKPLAAAFEALRESLWLIPAIAVLFALVLAELAVFVSGEVTLPWLPLAFSGGPDAAQALLQAIAGSLITVTGVTFSVTIIALQLTSTQFSPRVLRNFIRDRASQSVLAIFLATFVYTLMVLGSVRTGSDGQEAFVPVLAVVGAVTLTLLSIGMLAFFIHHIAHMIQVSSITESVGRETVEVARRQWLDPDDGGDPSETPAPSGDEAVLPAREGGYVVYVATDRLMELAREADAVLRVGAAPGQWIAHGRPLVLIAPHDARHRLRRDPRDQIELGPQPTLQQDVSFGVRQLVDVALKALSPSINDPSTAVNCIHRLTDILLEVGRRREPLSVHCDDDGAVRLVFPQHDFADLVGLAFDQLRHFGGDRVYVALAITEALETLLDDLSPHRAPHLRRQARLLLESARSIEPAEDRRQLVEELEALAA